MCSAINDFNLDGFTPILPFGDEAPLDLLVQSDHTEVAVEGPDQTVINLWNISNPYYHHWYQSNRTFQATFMANNTPDGELLRSKINSQLNLIASRFAKEEVHVQVIDEAYALFIDQLQTKLAILGGPRFKIISQLDTAPPQRKWKNFSAILINTDRLKVEHSGVLYRPYQEINNEGQERDYFIPYASLVNRESGHPVMVVAAHNHGCDAQYPKSALEVAASAVQELWEMKNGEVDLIGVGDLNAPPEYVEKSLISRVGQPAELLRTKYPTHVNPRVEAASYDHAFVVPRKNTPHSYKVLDRTNLSLASRALIGSIERSRQLWLSANLGESPL